MNDIMKHVFQSSEEGKAGALSMEQAASFYKRLKQWRLHVPSPLRPQAIVLPTHLLMRYVNTQAFRLTPFRMTVSTNW